MPQVEDVVKVCDEVMVKVIGIDGSGRINLSRKAILEGLSNVPGAKVRNTSAPKDHPRKFVQSRGTKEQHGNRRK